MAGEVSPSAIDSSVMSDSENFKESPVYRFFTNTRLAIEAKQAMQISKDLPANSNPNAKDYMDIAPDAKEFYLPDDSYTTNSQSQSRSDATTPNATSRTAFLTSKINIMTPLKSTQEDSRYASAAPSSRTVLKGLNSLKKKSGPYHLYQEVLGASDPTLPPTITTSAASTSESPLKSGIDKQKALSDPPQLKRLLVDQMMKSPLPPGVLEEIFEDLQNVFGFQRDNMRNQLEALTILLDSRASRMNSPRKALQSIHKDYISGDNANYKLWYFSEQLGFDYLPSFLKSSGVGILDTLKVDSSASVTMSSGDTDVEDVEEQPGKVWLERAWRKRVKVLSDKELARHVALYLLIWGEASNVRFIPECLCFIFKLASDYYYMRPSSTPTTATSLPEGTFLRQVISPIYDFLRDQSYKIVNGQMIKRERDHAQTIGYDDCNELFWSKEGIESIVLDDKARLMSLPSHERYIRLKDVNWKSVFRKTFKERRTALHLVANFSRVWILHIAFFVTFLAWIAGPSFGADNKNLTLRLGYTCLGGASACLFALFSTVTELFFLPMTFRALRILSRRFMFLIFLMIVNVLPTAFIVLIASKSFTARMVSYAGLLISFVTTMYLVLVPNAELFSRKASKSQNLLTNPTFTAKYAPLKPSERALSYSIWILVFLSKMTESLFFLIMPVGRPLRVLATLNIKECASAAILCTVVKWTSLFLLIVLVLILFFLDTYMWWIVWSTALGVIRSVYLGLSIFTPWKNVFARLPERVYAKIVALGEMRTKLKPKIICSQIWNAIVVSLYNEHLINLEHLDKMLYHQHVSPQNLNKVLIEKPRFFTAQEDVSTKTEFFPKNSEAERRISYFAQSLSMSFPEPMSIQRMPTFTVLTPHYSEKILLPLRDIIREHDSTSTVTLLEYLKSLHPHEWENFVEDTKLFLREKQDVQSGMVFSIDTKGSLSTQTNSNDNDAAYQVIGFKHATPDSVLRTRLWASLRSQTLYRTISGFMNYAKAIKLLYRVENPELVASFDHTNEHELDAFLEQMALKKFKFVVAMQRYSYLKKDEKADVDFILRHNRNVQISYLEEETVTGSNGETTKNWYSVLIDGDCERLENGERKPKFRILLPGPPILGDGKSDNQNHSIIFVRGEAIQLIDSNQDQYFEEALKVRSILAEFVDAPTSSRGSSGSKRPSSTVAIIGGREFIFSERVGVLGDVAASKEFTFGTISQRVTSKLGGRAHYGHPDFLNSVFMLTRGGVSKAQKGLHLNEDIYTGMNALQRGGRIKHTEYMQCGKGRDLGFSSILMFTAKIGGGMGEQMLSREYYYLGTQLPLDRLLTFYYAHPGFHINNVFIMLSIQLFILFMLMLCSMMMTFTICEFKETMTDRTPLRPKGCANIHGVFKWIREAVFAIVIVFAVNFLPLFLQVLAENGLIASIKRLSKQVFSLSPLFDVFTTQIYSYTLLSNLRFGRAGYVATGRGFATSRIPFHVLYSSFASPSIYFGARLIVILVLVSATVKFGHLAFFWIMVLPLCLAPFLFNPHQFKFSEFFIDYGNLLSWFSAGHGSSSSTSWIAHHRSQRSQITGHKNQQRKSSDAKQPNTQGKGGMSRAKFSVIFMQEVLMPIVMAIICVSAYGMIHKSIKACAIIAAIGLAPVALNVVILIVLFPVSLLLGPCVDCVDSGWFGAFIAGVAHTFSVIGTVSCYVGAAFLGDWILAKTLLGLVAILFVQRAFSRIITVCFLSREMNNEQVNLAWWTGKWFGRGLGCSAMCQPLREFVCKIVEMMSFGMDFLLSHVILFALFPLCLIPFIDRWHTIMLLWMTPKDMESRNGKGSLDEWRFLTKTQRRTRMKQIIFSFLLFLTLFSLFVGICFVLPRLAGMVLPNVNSKVIL